MEKTYELIITVKGTENDIEKSCAVVKLKLSLLAN